MREEWDEPPAPRISFSLHEALHLGGSVVILTIAFALVMGARSDTPPFLDVGQLVALLPFAALAVIPAFILHELAHKIVAQRKDMWAEFRANPLGLVGGLVLTALTGFLFAVPGAVEIVGRASKRDAGVISIWGPMVNIGIAGLALVLEPLFPPVRVAGFGSFFELVVLLNVILAAFNMLPIGPLDGRKVWRWSKLGFFGMWLIIVALFVIAFRVDIPI